MKTARKWVGIREEIREHFVQSFFFFCFLLFDCNIRRNVGIRPNILFSYILFEFIVYRSATFRGAVREGKIAFNPIYGRIVFLQPIVSKENILSSKFRDCELNGFRMCLSVEVEFKTSSDDMSDRSGSVQSSIGIPDRNGMFEGVFF